jgi:hypothetical protein
MDPISAKLTESALKNVGQVSTQVGKTGAGYGVDQSGFGRILDSQMQTNQTTNAKLLEFVENMGGDTMSPQINAIPANGINIDVAKSGELQGSSNGNGRNIFDIFKEVNDTQLNMDNIMETVVSGNKKFTTQEMIRIQVMGHMNAIYMETISKVGEMANKAISTPFNMQIS